MPGEEEVLPQSRRTMPGGEEVQPQSCRTMPGGEEVQPQSRRTMPGGEEVQPQSPLSVPGGEEVQPQSPRTMPGGEEVLPQSPLSVPGGEEVLPQSPRTMPGGEEVQPQSPLSVPGGEEVLPQSPCTMPGGEEVQPQSRLTVPGGEEVQPQSPLSVPGGEEVQPQSPLSVPGGEEVQPQSPRTMPGGEEVQPQSPLTVPGGEEVQPQSPLSVPGGEEVQPQSPLSVPYKQLLQQMEEQAKGLKDFKGKTIRVLKESGAPDDLIRKIEYSPSSNIIRELSLHMSPVDCPLLERLVMAYNDDTHSLSTTWEKYSDQREMELKKSLHDTDMISIPTGMVCTNSDSLHLHLQTSLTRELTQQEVLKIHSYLAQDMGLKGVKFVGVTHTVKPSLVFSANKRQESSAILSWQSKQKELRGKFSLTKMSLEGSFEAREETHDQQLMRKLFTSDVMESLGEVLKSTVQRTMQTAMVSTQMRAHIPEYCTALNMNTCSSTFGMYIQCHI